MNSAPDIRIAGRRQTMALSVFILIQTLGTVFFVGDVIGDLRENPISVHFIFEAVVTAALVMGIIFGAVALRRTIELLQAQEQALDVARGALADVIDRQFNAWGLTPAERDVAFLALKGFDVAEIADLRGAAQGTVRAQLTRIYAKADVSGRAQFAAFFVEDLMGQGRSATRKCQTLVRRFELRSGTLLTCLARSVPLASLA
jgi:DNA-binding CsgD family transcriptional regulator